MNRPRRAKSWLQLALCLAMWLGLLVPVAPAAAAVTAPATVNAAAPATTPSATTTPGTTTAEQEVVALRTRTSRTYQTARGYQAVISTHSVNYQDATGAWQPIDDSLVPATTSGYAYQNTANAYTALLPAALGSPVTMKRGNVSVSFTLVGASGTLTTKADTASYAAALPGVDVAYQAQADALEETLTLHSAAAAATYTYTLATSGVTARANAMGGVDFLDGAGQVQLSFAPPIMQDSSHTPAGLSRAVHLTLAPDGASVTLAADPAWLADPARVYPVVLDPTAVATPDDQCTIGSGPEADLNMCGLPTYYLGNDGTEVHRSLLQFYTKELPAQANVLNADLAVYVTYQSGGGSMAMQAFQLTQSWAGGGSTTWDAASSGVGWTTPGGTYAPTIQYQTTLGATGTWYHWGITNLVQGWANGTVANNYGVLLKAADEMTAGYWGFDATTDSTAPTLTVTYQPWIGEQAFWGYSRRQLTDRMDINVNLANGAVIAHSNDLAIAGTGLPVSLDRYYNQTLTTVDINTTPTHELGPNWVLDWGSTWYLATSGLNGVAYYEPGGDAFMFAANPDGSFTHPPGLDALLVKNGDGTYTLTDQATGTRDHFAAPDSDGIARPTALVDRDGNTISLQRNADGTLAAIVDTQGRTISFGYVAGTSPSYLGSVTDSSGRTVNYAYDGKYLDHVVDANGKTTAYRYSDDILQKIIDANGNTTLINYANSQVSSIVYVTDPNTNTGPTYAFAYNTGNTVVTDPNNHQTTYYYDVYGRITKVVDALGNSQQYSYTADNNVAQYTDAASKVTTLTYSTDGRNNLIQAQGPTGYAASWQYTDSAHPYYPTQFTDPQGNTLSYGYDPNGNLLTTTDQLATQNQLKATYNANGTVATTTDADGNQTSYNYDGKGNLTGITPPAPLGATTIGPDALSRPHSVTDGKGQTTTYTFDALDRVTNIAYADSTSVGYVIDADGNVTSLTDGTGTTSYVYDPLNRMTQKTPPGAGAINYTYDGVGNLLTVADPSGTVSYHYTPVNLVDTLTDQGNQQITFQYNAQYHRTSTAYPNGVTMTQSYDDSQRLTSIVAKNSGGTTLTSFTYSYANGSGGDTSLRTSVTDLAGKTTAYAYDARNRLLEAQTKNGGGTVTKDYQYTYDGNGNRLTQTVDRLQKTTYGYNAANELTTAGGTSYSFDADGQETGNSAGLALVYNAKQQTASVTPPGGSAIAMAYRGANQAERATAGSTSYETTLLGVAGQTDSTGTTAFVRDNRGVLAEERAPGGTYYYLFDGLGSVVGLTDSGGNVVDTYSYTPYGTLANSTGSVANPFRFAGGLLGGLYVIGGRR